MVVDAFATLRLAADNLIPKTVTNIMMHRPEVFAIKGERLYPGSKSNARAKTGTWFISTDYLNELSPNQHLELIYSLVEPHIVELKEIYPDLSVTFSVLAGIEVNIDEGLKEKVSALGKLETAFNQAA